MIVNLVARVHVREFLALYWRIVGTVVETIALPGGSSKFGPLDVVIRQLARFQVDDEDFLPVAAATRDGVGSILAVMREIDTLQGHRSVSAQLVGIEEHTRLASQLVHHVHHVLVL